MRLLKPTIPVLFGLFLSSCSNAPLTKTVPNVDIMRFMGPWYVQAGRFTIFEKDPYNSLETYTWNEKEKRIDIDFRYNQGSINGPIKTVPQKGWVQDLINNSTWDIQPFWPLKFKYLIIGLGQDYEWTAIGVPSQKFLWIMTREAQFSRTKINEILSTLKMNGYPIENVQYVTHKK